MVVRHYIDRYIIPMNQNQSDLWYAKVEYLNECQIKQFHCFSFELVHTKFVHGLLNCSIASCVCQRECHLNVPV